MMECVLFVLVMGLTVDRGKSLCSIMKLALMALEGGVTINRQICSHYTPSVEKSTLLWQLLDDTKFYSAGCTVPGAKCCSVVNKLIIC